MFVLQKITRRHIRALRSNCLLDVWVLGHAETFVVLRTLYSRSDEAGLSNRWDLGREHAEKMVRYCNPTLNCYIRNAQTLSV